MQQVENPKDIRVTLEAKITVSSVTETPGSDGQVTKVPLPVTNQTATGSVELLGEMFIESQVSKRKALLEAALQGLSKELPGYFKDKIYEGAMRAAGGQIIPLAKKGDKK